MQRFNIKIYGKVQGVFFRASTKAEAERQGIKGTVANLSDGTVYIEAEGTSESLHKFIEYCHVGPEHAVIEKVEVTEDKIENFKNFVII